MNVYPLSIHLGSFELTGYGIMMMVAFLAGGWLIALETRRRGLNEEYVGDILIGAVIGGIVGAKLWYVVLTHDLTTLFSRGGLVWYGGFLGGSLGVLAAGWVRRVPVRWTMQLVGPVLPACYALGRVGCFLVQDDYGRPTDLPWAMKFPQGLPPSTAGNLQQLFHVPVPAGVTPDTVLAVHPTQLYEVALMLGVFALMWPMRRKANRGTGWLFGVYLMYAGVERFLVEIVRAKDDRFLGIFTVAQLTSVLLVVLGTALYLAWRNADEVAPGEFLGAARRAA